MVALHADAAPAVVWGDGARWGAHLWSGPCNCHSDILTGDREPGQGDTDHLTRSWLACDERLLLTNGMPTDELTAAASAACGVTSYSSAVLNLVPEVATAYRRAVVAGDTAVTDLRS